MRVFSTISESIGILLDSTSSSMIGSTNLSFAWCLDECRLLIGLLDKKYYFVSLVLVLTISGV